MMTRSRPVLENNSILKRWFILPKRKTRSTETTPFFEMFESNNNNLCDTTIEVIENVRNLEID